MDQREFHSPCGTVHDLRVSCPARPSQYVLTDAPAPELVNHPEHYNTVPDIECIDVIEHFNLNRGNAIKYIWRAGEKDPAREVEDLEKARWYIEREITRLKVPKKA